jgi:hypothetical protein
MLLRSGWCLRGRTVGARDAHRTSNSLAHKRAWIIYKVCFLHEDDHVVISGLGFAICLKTDYYAQIVFYGLSTFVKANCLENI